MRLIISENKDGSRNLYVGKSYRNASGKSTTKIVEKLGSYSELAEKYGDPVAWANTHIAELNRAEKENSGEVCVKFSQAESLVKGEQQLYEGGYLFLQKLYHELRLDYICERISAKYDYSYSLNRILQTLLYGRILFPKSKSGTLAYANRLLEKPGFALHDLYRGLSVLAKESNFIQSQVYRFSKELGKRNDQILYYDCTNYYFEIEDESGIRKYGVSKEHRPNPIVEMGLFMDGDGIPLAFCLESGNTNEQQTMIPLEQQIIQDYQHAKFIVCTDAGLSSAKNKAFNSDGERAYITAQSIKKMKAQDQAWALSPEGWHLSGAHKAFNLQTLIVDEALCQKYYEDVFYKETWLNPEERCIVTFSLKYKAYCQSIRQRQIERAQKAMRSPGSIEKQRQTDYKRLIKKLPTTPSGELAEKISYTLDEEAIAKEAQFDGFYAVTTSLEDSGEKIAALNKRRWEIEECFRIMKTEFSARPVYLSRDDRIQAHFLTCFLALMLYRYLEIRVDKKYTCTQLLETLRDYKFVRIPSDGYLPAYTRTDITDALHEAFGFRTDRQIISKAAMKKIIADTKKRAGYYTSEKIKSV